MRHATHTEHVCSNGDLSCLAVLTAPPLEQSIPVSPVPCVQGQSLGVADQRQARNRGRRFEDESEAKHFRFCSAMLEGKTVDDPTVPQKPGPTQEANSEGSRVYGVGTNHSSRGLDWCNALSSRLRA